MKVAENIFARLEIPKGLWTGIFSLGLSTIIVKILGLFYKIPLSFILGDEGMGYFNSAYTVYAFFYLLCTAGVPKAVMMLVSEAKAKGKEQEEIFLVRTAVQIFAFLGLAFTILFILFADPLSRLIGNSKSKATMIAIAPTILFVSLSGVVRGYLNAHMKLLHISVSQIIEGVGKLVVGLLLASLGKRLCLPLEMISALTILGISVGAIFGLIYLLICSKMRLFYVKTGQNAAKTTRHEIAKRIFSISLPITLSAAVMSLTNLIDLGLIMSSLEKIGYTESQSNALYGNYTTLAVPMFNLAMAIITPISVSFVPAFTDCIVNMDHKGLIDTEKSAYSVSAFIATPLTFGLVLFSSEILDLLFVNSETVIGSHLLRLLAPAIILSSILINLNNYLEAQRKFSAPLISMIVGSLAKIIASYYIITKSGMGILGAPIGTVISYAVALLVSLTIYAVVNKRYPPIIYAYFIPFLISFATVGIARKMFDMSHKRTLDLAIAILFSALLYLTLSLFVAAFQNGNIRKMAKSPKMYAKNYQISRKLKNN